MKKVFKITMWLVLVLVVLAGLVYVWAWKSPAYYTISGTPALQDSIVPFRDYHRIANHPRPYVLEGKNYFICAGPGFSESPK